MTTTALNSIEFRNVIGRFMSGVTVISTHSEGIDYGMTASSVASLSMDPPMLLVCLNRKIATQKAVNDAGVFAVNILGEDQGWVAKHFGGPREDKFDAVEVTRGENNVPILADSLAHLQCRVVEQVDAGTHTVYMAEVTEAVSVDGEPLAYYRGTFGRFELQQNAEAYAVIRRSVLDRTYPVDEILEPLRLAQDLELSVDSVHDALTKLSADDFVERTPEGYVQKPYDVERTQNAFELKLIIDLAVADQTVGKISADQLNELERLDKEIGRHLNGNAVINAHRYREASAEFQNYFVGLAGNDALVDSLKRVSVPSIIAHAPGLRDTIPASAISYRSELVAAYRQEDLEQVKAIIRKQSDLVMHEWARAIEKLGGKL